jgi:hypothetical protein
MYINIILRCQLNGQDRSLLLRTMHGQNTTKSKPVSGLIVSSSNGHNPIELPRSFTRPEIPVEHSHIPRTELQTEWTNLQEAIREMPAYLLDVPIGLLIWQQLCKGISTF